jgi:hypothetical protein
MVGPSPYVVDKSNGRPGKRLLEVNTVREPCLAGLEAAKRPGRFILRKQRSHKGDDEGSTSEFPGGGSRYGDSRSSDICCMIHFREPSGMPGYCAASKMFRASVCDNLGIQFLTGCASRH